MMRITIEGFGSMWSTRSRRDPRHPERERVAFYNTTGVTLNGKVQHRSRIFGQLRFNGTGGFIANEIERNIDRVFCCAAELGRTGVKLMFRYLAAKPESPDFFLFAVKSNVTGFLQIESEHWKSAGVLLCSLSQSKESQEAILLMQAHSWIRGGLGTFIVEPDCDRPWRATLRLLG
jgi:hypothetical protein